MPNRETELKDKEKEGKPLTEEERKYLENCTAKARARSAQRTFDRQSVISKLKHNQKLTAKELYVKDQIEKGRKYAQQHPNKLQRIYAKKKVGGILTTEEQEYVEERNRRRRSSKAIGNEPSSSEQDYVHHQIQAPTSTRDDATWVATSNNLQPHTDYDSWLNTIHTLPIPASENVSVDGDEKHMPRSDSDLSFDDSENAINSGNAATSDWWDESVDRGTAAAEEHMFGDMDLPLVMDMISMLSCRLTALSKNY